MIDFLVASFMQKYPRTIAYLSRPLPRVRTRLSWGTVTPSFRMRIR